MDHLMNQVLHPRYPFTRPVSCTISLTYGEQFDSALQRYLPFTVLASRFASPRPLIVHGGIDTSLVSAFLFMPRLAGFRVAISTSIHIQMK